MSHPAGTMLQMRWNPWGALRASEELLFGLTDLPEGMDGLYLPHADEPVILLDASLDNVARRCALAHEVVHHERGSACGAVGQPSAWDTVIAREEVRVHDEAVRRLVPPDELRAFCTGRADYFAVEPHEIAEEFHVTDEYAERALFLLTTKGQS